VCGICHAAIVRFLFFQQQNRNYIKTGRTGFLVPFPLAKIPMEISGLLVKGKLYSVLIFFLLEIYP